MVVDNDDGKSLCCLVLHDSSTKRHKLYFQPTLLRQDSFLQALLTVTDSVHNRKFARIRVGENPYSRIFSAVVI